MKKTLTGFLPFLLMLAVLVVALKVLNWVPLVVQKESARRYNSVEEVRRTLNVRDILVPTYFPQQISWPPSEILAQGAPFPAVVMTFHRAGTGEAALVIVQSEGRPLNIGDAIHIAAVKEKVAYTMLGRDAELTVGACKNGEPCSRITWKEGDYSMTVLMKATPFELTKIAESMLR